MILVVSELVTNALRHGGGTATMNLTAHPNGIEVAVHDLSPQPPGMHTPDLNGGTGGFGRPTFNRLAHTTTVTPGPPAARPSACTPTDSSSAAVTTSTPPSPDSSHCSHVTVTAPYPTSCAASAVVWRTRLPRTTSSSRPCATLDREGMVPVPSTPDASHPALMAPTHGTEAVSMTCTPEPAL